MEETYQCISEWECCCWRVRSAAEDMGGRVRVGAVGVRVSERVRVRERVRNRITGLHTEIVE